MPYQLKITAAAVADTITAYRWYEEKQEGLGERFLEALSERYDDLVTHPQYYSYITEDRLQVLRDVKVNGFPYVIVYEIDDAAVIITPSITHIRKRKTSAESKTHTLSYLYTPTCAASSPRSLPSWYWP